MFTLMFLKKSIMRLKITARKGFISMIRYIRLTVYDRQEEFNGWSLTELYNSLIAQHKTKEAATYETQYAKPFEEADVDIKPSVF